VDLKRRERDRSTSEHHQPRPSTCCNHSQRCLGFSSSRNVIRVGLSMPTTELEEERASSQGDTEPLTFDEEDAEGEMDDDQDMLEAEATNALVASSNEQVATQGGNRAVSGALDTGMADVEGEDEESEADQDNVDPDADGDEDAMGSDEEDEEGQGIDGLGGSQATSGNLSPNKQAAGATFSDESELTDEPDEDDEDAEGEDEEEEEEGDDEGEDDDDEVDEDEAAKGLAALTSGQTVSTDGSSADASTASNGLEGLAVLAAAEAAEDSQGEEDTDNDSIAGSQVRNKSRKHPSAIPRRTATRLNEVIVASPQLSEDDEEEEDEAEESGLNGQGSLLKSVTTSSKTNRGLSSLLGLNVAKRNAKQGAAGLLAGAPSITVEGLGSGLPSAATSREASPVQDEMDEGQLGEEDKDDLEQERDEAGTPVQEIDEAQAEDEPTTDEAALRRLEAMAALTKIEIGFAHLRDKLYMERMEEVNKEGEMILDGTHPDLIHLSNLIENRREKKLKLVDKWFEQEEKQYERVAKAEEAAVWNNWRNEVVELRKQQMNDAARKRRKLDREKRSLDGPRPARRHQIFETELIRNPDYDRKLRMHYQNNKTGKIRDENEMGAYVAFPDLRGAADHESWMDMEQMGIAPDARFVAMGPGGFYRPEDVGMDPYAMYPMEQQPIPGPNAGFYEVPPAAEFATYDRAYDNRGGQHAYVVDGYGRPLSPPPPSAPHAFANAQSQRGGSRVAQVEPSHHAHSSYNTGSKVHRRSPPLASMDERDVKHYSKPVDAAPVRGPGQRMNSPPISSHQNVRPPSHYPKQNHGISEEAFYNPSGSKNSIGPSSIPAPRPKIGPANEGYINRHSQEHHYSR
jgi:hypothetical protein